MKYILLFDRILLKLACIYALDWRNSVSALSGDFALALRLGRGLISHLFYAVEAPMPPRPHRIMECTNRAQIKVGILDLEA